MDYLPAVFMLAAMMLFGACLVMHFVLQAHPPREGRLTRITRQGRRRLLLAMTLFHGGMSLIALAANGARILATPWSASALLLANLAASLVLSTLFMFCRRLEASTSMYVDYHFTWRDARDAPLFLAGVAAFIAAAS